MREEKGMVDAMRASVLCSTLLAIVFFSAAAIRAEGPIIKIVGRSAGRTFEGLGALSAGASSRLLLDYPEPQRSEILDFLFKPNFGASLQHLKVEIGGDVNSTDGTEPSHARTREEFEHPRPEYYQRGYEWWIMREAKRRNPQILLDVLQWGAPAWIGGGKFWSQDNADFIAAFLHAANRQHGLDIDFCGLWNERPHDAAWIKVLRKTLDDRGLAQVKIIAADECDGGTMWNIGREVLADRELAAAVYAVGAHYPHWHSTPECVQTAKPLFASEDGPWRGDWPGACTLAKSYNRNYIEGKITKTVIWSLISSYYDILPLPNSGPMKAIEPWSGHYEVQPAIWAIAHTTQFAQPGWRYLDSACGLLPGEGSYVTLRSPGREQVAAITASLPRRSTPGRRKRWFSGSAEDCRRGRCTFGGRTSGASSSSLPTSPSVGMRRGSRWSRARSTRSPRPPASIEGNRRAARADFPCPIATILSPAHRASMRSTFRTRPACSRWPFAATAAASACGRLWTERGSSGNRCASPARSWGRRPGRTMRWVSTHALTAAARCRFSLAFRASPRMQNRWQAIA